MGPSSAYAPPPPANHETPPQASGATVAKQLWWAKDNPGDPPGAPEAGGKGPTLLVNRSVRALLIFRIGNCLMPQGAGVRVSALWDEVTGGWCSSERHLVPAAEAE